MKVTKSRAGAVGALSAALVTATCLGGERTGPGNRAVPTTVVVSPGEVALGFVGEQQDFTARVYDQNGGSLPAAAVSWSVSDTLVFAVVGDSASATITAVANGSAMLFATAEEAVDTVDVTVRQGAGAMEILSGDGQTGFRETALPEPLAVRITDRGGTPAEGVEVAFAPAEESGSVGDTLVATDIEGRAASEWTLGTARSQSVTASAGSGRLVFSARANANPPMPDYALLEGLEFTRLDPLDTDIIELSATIANLGDGIGPATFPARITLDGETFRTVNIDGIDPGSASTVTMRVGPFEPGERVIGMEIDPRERIMEWDDGNNTAEGTLTVLRQRTIALGEAVTLESSTVGEVFLFRVYVPQGSRLPLNIELTGGSGDADIFGHYGERPGYRYRYRCFDVGADTDELCQMVPARAGTYHVAVHAFTAFGPSTLRVTIEDRPVPPFDIDLAFLDGGTAAQRDAVAEAAARWESIIARDVIDWDHGGFDRVPAGTCGPGSPEVTDMVDDIRVFVTIGEIDGEGGTVARSGPCWVRPYPLEGAEGVWLQPTLAAIVLDRDDVAYAEAHGMLVSFVTHELAHALGFVPSVWERHGLLRNPSLPNSPGADTHFDGRRAVLAFDAAGGKNYPRGKVPVENGATPGLSDANWRESVFGDELMSAVLTGETQPLSLITIEAFHDIGYEVDVRAADAYSVGGATAARAPSGGGVMDLGSDVAPWPVRVLRFRGKGGR